jgi:hypothetical protein
MEIIGLDKKKEIKQERKKQNNLHPEEKCRGMQFLPKWTDSVIIANLVTFDKDGFFEVIIRI